MIPVWKHLLRSLITYAARTSDNRSADSPALQITSLLGCKHSALPLGALISNFILENPDMQCTEAEFSKYTEKSDAKFSPLNCVNLLKRVNREAVRSEFNITGSIFDIEMSILEYRLSLDPRGLDFSKETLKNYVNGITVWENSPEESRSAYTATIKKAIERVNAHCAHYDKISRRNIEDLTSAVIKERVEMSKRAEILAKINAVYF